MFVIDGVWKLTAERAVLTIEARDQEQALVFARSRGFIPIQVRTDAPGDGHARPELRSPPATPSRE